MDLSPLKFINTEYDIKRALKLGATDKLLSDELIETLRLSTCQ